MQDDSAWRILCCRSQISIGGSGSSDSLIGVREMRSIAPYDPAAQADLLKQLSAAKVAHENYYLSNVTILTVARGYDDNGRLRKETSFKFISGKDRFLLRTLENREFPENTPIATKDIILGTPHGIYSII